VEWLSVNSIAATTAIDLTGNEFGQALQGNNGSNALNGGGGADVLYGWGGDDTFMFTTALDAATNVDTIADFSVADDRIWLDDAIFQALAPGTLSASAFTTGTAASDSGNHIIYDDATGWLSYDADGDGEQAQIHFATLNAHLTLTSDNFYVG
jgi:Ca2+-binding RTX toxin-like protein